MTSAASSVDAGADPHVESLEAEHSAEEKWSFAGRLVSMAAGTAAIGALAAPEVAVAGAVVGGLIAILLGTRDRTPGPG